MTAARVAAEALKSISNIDTNLAGRNRSGVERLLPGPDKVSAASNKSDSRAAQLANCQVVRPGGVRQAPDSQAVDRNQLLGESEQETMADDTAEGEGGDVQIIEPSPTNFSYDHMPKTVGGRAFIRATEQSFQARLLINKLIDKADIKVREMASLEAEREEGDSEDEDYLLVQRDLVDDHERIRVSLKEHLNVSHEIEFNRGGDD